MNNLDAQNTDTSNSETGHERGVDDLGLSATRLAFLKEQMGAAIAPVTQIPDLSIPASMLKELTLPSNDLMAREIKRIQADVASRTRITESIAASRISEAIRSDTSRAASAIAQVQATMAASLSQRSELSLAASRISEAIRSDTSRAASAIAQVQATMAASLSQRSELSLAASRISEAIRSDTSRMAREIAPYTGHFDYAPIVLPARRQDSLTTGQARVVHEYDLLGLEHQLISLLERFNPDLVDILEGAFYALASSSPDRIRQAVVSMRHVVDVVLDRLAPPSVVAARVGKDKPNREDKYKYALQTLNAKPMASVIEHDAKSFHSLMAILSENVHTNAPTVTEDQLLYALIRCQQALIVLLRITIYGSSSKNIQ